MKIREITFDEFSYKHKLSSMRVFGKFSPAVFKNDNGYGIRIKTGESWHGANTTYEWDYFNLDATGLITSSPRGLAKLFNKKVKITDIEKQVGGCKDKPI